MAVVFYVLGTIVVAVGGLWVGATAFTALSVNAGAQGATAVALAAIPGFSAIVTGLLLLAIAGVLSRLDHIIENTRSLRTLGGKEPVDTSKWSARDREAYEKRPEP